VGGRKKIFPKGFFKKIFHSPSVWPDAIFRVPKVALCYLNEYSILRWMSLRLPLNPRFIECCFP